MNTNYETVLSLIELLVKKAGFDLSNNYSEIELQKTKDSISSLLKERNSSGDKKAVSALLENLKVRQANWENNAEMVGKSLLKAFEEGKDYPTVKMRIELLANLAKKGTDNISVGSVYDRIRNLDSEYKTLLNKIENTDYTNISEKEMDSRYKTYLENKLLSLEDEVAALDKELDSLREVEFKDVGIVSKIKEYISKLKTDKEKIEKAVKSSITSNIELDVWQRLENARNGTDEKLKHANELLKKTEETLDSVKKNRDNINERKKMLDTEKSRCNNKLNNINIKLQENSYENSTERMIDVNNSEMLKSELLSLNNKKDVIYVDVDKVKEELVKAWSRVGPPRKDTLLDPLIEEDVGEKTGNKEEVLQSKKEDIIETKSDDTLIENVLLDEETDIDKVMQDLDKLIEQSKNQMKELTQITVDPNMEVRDKPIEVKEKKNKIELDW